MTNSLVGDVYLKIIEEVASTSANDFEENAVNQVILQELQQEWQAKLSQRGVAQMPWDPKPVTASSKVNGTPANPNPPEPSKGVPMGRFFPDGGPGSPPQTNNATANDARIKTEPGTEPQYNGMSNAYPPPASLAQGGMDRATHLLQQQYGPAANASIANLQRRGLALPGQPQAAKPQGLHLPNSSPQQAQQPYSPQQHQQQASLPQQQQGSPQIKRENDTPPLGQGSMHQHPQHSMPVQYSQTDGADDALEQWQAMLAERRAFSAETREQADSFVRDQVSQLSSDLESGLMVPLSEHRAKARKQKHKIIVTTKAKTPAAAVAVAGPSATPVPQLDGNLDDDDEKADLKEDIKDEDDDNAINSDLDDSDDEGNGDMEEDDGDDYGDRILCTYDKVQRVKARWKCMLKDGVMSVDGKDWVFHKGSGEFEW